jgi:hypothetical protein
MENSKSEKDYNILGVKYKAKPLKLQLNKDSYHLIKKINEYVKDVTGLLDEEMKMPEHSFAVSLAIMGFVSIKENCVKVLNLLIEEDTDWTNFISENKEQYDEIKTITVNILKDFFLNVMKLTGVLNH